MSFCLTSFVFYYTIDSYYEGVKENKILQFEEIINQLEANKQKLILLSLLAETEIHLPVFSKNEITDVNVYEYSSDENYSITDDELIISRIMKLSANFLPDLFASNKSKFYYRSNQNKLVLHYDTKNNDYSGLISNVDNCAIHESCTLYSTSEQIQDRVVFSLFFGCQDDQDCTISLSSPVIDQKTKKIIGDFVLDMVIDNPLFINFDFISYLNKNKKVNLIIENSILDVYEEYYYNLDNLTEIKLMISKSNKYIDYYFVFIFVFLFLLLLSYKWLDFLRHKKDLIEAKVNAITDELTGLNNRKLLNDNDFIDTHTNEGTAIIAFDGNHIKKINDQLGHSFGDEAIKTMANSLKIVFRESDYLFRLGGDEFLAILPGCSSPKTIELMDKVKLEVNKHSIGGIGLSISCGAVHLEAYESISQAIARADDALYIDKLRGRN